MSTITRVLVANRGEIARRVFRTARAMGLQTVAVYADGDAAAPFVADADRAIALGGATAAESYLDSGRIIDAARRSGADAIHPGYGFLSESAELARRTIDGGLVWIGPPPEAMEALGDKLAAKRLMAGAGVPTLPSVEVAAGTDLAAAGEGLGYPVLVKAAAGGGGRGMRVVGTAAELADAVDGARREAAAAFGDDTIFLERYLAAGRHVEIQILADAHGGVVHCFERECSIQRRHQKVIEEAPSPAMTPELRSAMGSAAIAAARAIGYRSAGTVEFMLTASGDEYYFLEVNTRLQVEHPVTEEVTGLDLVREQLRIAAGESLGYGQDALAMSGHAVEARIYAEDPATGFLPAIGRIAVWEPAADPPVRFDSGIDVGSEVGVEFDPMLAKVIAHAPTRREAALRLALALERTRLGGVTTNRDFLVAALRSPEFLAGDTTTDFIERVAPSPHRWPERDELEASAIAVAMAARAANRASARVWGFAPGGWRNTVMPVEQLQLRWGDTDLTVRYRRLRDGTVEATVGDGAPHGVSVHAATGERVDVEVDGQRSAFALGRAGDRWYVHGPGGDLELDELPRFPLPEADAVAGGQVAPMPGKVVTVRVGVGDPVAAGQVLIVVEAMKMEHTVTAPEAGVVTEILVTEGDQVDTGALLVVVDSGSG